MQQIEIFIVLQTIFLLSSAALKGSSRVIQEITHDCPYGEFPCNSTDTCVEQRKNCDGVRDCEDGSDEQNCEDYNRIDYWNSLFRKRPDEDREKEVEGCELKNIPPKCRCSSFNVFCENQGLERPPDKLPANVQELDLSGNKLHILEPRNFQKSELHTLILTSSEVTLINKNTFKNLPKLTELYLTANQIRVIVNGTFASNSNLELLVLSHNPLTFLQSGAFEGLGNLAELDLRDCSLEVLPIGVFDSLISLKTLWLDGNKLTLLNKSLFIRSRNLHTLSISRNELKVIKEENWYGLTTIRSLSLSQNSLMRLSGDSFGNMTTLLKLDLHGNKLKMIDKEAFYSLPNLESLNLKMNELKKKPTEGVFDSLTSLEHIYFDDFHFCSLALHVRVCEPRGDGISSIAHLLDSVVLRVSVWLVACVACVGNVAVLIGRLVFFSEPNEVHSFYIKNLSLADLIMSVYLFVIAAYDVAFRGQYIHHEEKWRHSWQCNFCGFLSTLSSESSIFILTIITSDRYMSIIHPLSLKKRTVFAASVGMALAWSLAVLLSALPMLKLSYYGDEFYGNNGVCLPLHIHDPFGQAWEYSTFLFCAVNLAAFLFILFAYISMFFTISHSKIGLRCTQQQQDRNIAKRFAFIVGTDFLCWVPIVFIKFIAMGGVPIQEDLYAWVAVFLLPVNSAINPILYTLTTKLFKQHLAKMVYNFKVTSVSGDSLMCGRNHSIRGYAKDSFSKIDSKSIALVMSRICPECRNHKFVRQSSRDSNTFELTCPHGKRLSTKRLNSNSSNAI